MTLAADTRSVVLPPVLSDLLRAVRSRLPRRDAAPVSTGDAVVRALCHDMRSPLASLEGLLARLGRDHAGSPDELVELARAQAEHLSSMLRTADATGGAAPRRGVRSLGDVLRASAEASGLPPAQLTVELAGDSADVEVADARVQRILTNLLENAHRHGAGAAVGLRAERRRGWVSLALTQRGVPADQVLHHLRRPTPPADLTGLGLWSVQRQTRELGGRLAWAQGTEGAFTLVVQLPDR